MYVGKLKTKTCRSRLGVRLCSRLFKSRFKNSQAAERRSKLLWSL